MLRGLVHQEDCWLHIDSREIIPTQDACSREETCEGGSECMQLGSRTRMSREDNHPENRRLCGKLES